MSLIILSLTHDCRVLCVTSGLLLPGRRNFTTFFRVKIVHTGNLFSEMMGIYESIYFTIVMNGV